ncbi:MAG: hypothetical protein LBJ73_02315 [Rickettsiales bacterium]|jgi:hypothetical protein|nr:hypothetical protein [Rickettsiales bacterium]
MKKSTIIALLVWAFALQGAFARYGSDTTGNYEEYGYSESSTPATDYNNGIYTTYNTGMQYPGVSSTYKGQDVLFSGYPNRTDLISNYLLQSVCASVGGTNNEISCSIGRTNQNNNLSDDEKICWCRLKRIGDNLSYDGWVFVYTTYEVGACASYCPDACAAFANNSPDFRDALLSAFYVF